MTEFDHTHVDPQDVPTVQGPSELVVLRNDTLGLSPKVYVPLALNLVTGFGLLIAGLVADVEPIWGAGLGLLTAGGVGGAVGYKASPGDIISEVEVEDAQ